MLAAAHRRVVTLVVAAFLTVGLAIGGLLVHVPYVELSPGLTCDTLSECKLPNGQTVTVLDIDHKTYPTSGQLRFTTVSVRGGPGARIDLLTAIRGWFDDDVAIVPEELVYPPGQTEEQVECTNQAQQLQSQSTATTAALRHLDFEVDVTRQVYIAAIGGAGNARRAGLSTCDLLLEVDGVRVTGSEQLVELVGQHDVGDTVQVRYRRGDDTRTVRVRLAADPDDETRPIIGIQPEERELSDPPFDVTINVEDVGGPSAGLMFALGIIDQLTEGDLTGGEAVAGTGEIDDAGKVGAIGGIQQKLVGARRDGATVFLTPAANCEEAARAVPDGLRLARVATLEDALSALGTLRGEPGEFKDC